MKRRKSLRKLISKKTRKSLRKLRSEITIKGIRKNLRSARKSFKKLTLKQKLITSGMGVATAATSFIIPIPGTSIPVAAATRAYVKRSLRRNKKKGRKKRKKREKKKKKKKN